MSGFNASGRKEDFSMKLRAQNMKNAKDTTKKLEQDNRKMEERLKELKMAMNREKEERERQGGGFWQRGQTGTLNSYASEVLQEKSNKQQSASKKKKVKLLSDEPLDLPVRKGGPGTIKYIAQRGSPRIELNKDSSKNKGTKCGQCEDRAASLTCVQCSEHYCAGCFAAFHLKGALKRHRSVPLHATGPRQCMSPRPTPPASGRDSFGAGSGATSGDVFYQADRHGPSAASGSVDSDYDAGGNSLFDGAYNEADSAASFQQALMAWRQGDKSDSGESSPARKAVVVSPVKSPVVTVECSTSTTDVRQKVPDLKFSSHSLTYAQRLMLKQHRRTELPSLGNYSTQSSTPTSDLTLVTPRSEVTLVSPRPAPGHSNLEEDDAELDEERVDFQSLFEAVTSTSSTPISRTTGCSLSVVDVTNSPQEQRSASAESSTYTVEEISSIQAWDVERRARLQDTQQISVSQSPLEPPADTTQQRKRLSKSRETTHVIDKTRLPKSRETTHVVLSSKMPVTEVPQLEEEEAAVPEVRKKPPPAAAARPKSVASRPASRAKSARSRPGSRAQSRAQSRLGMEGILTKTPSSDLKEIARRAQATSAQYQSPMEDFFLAGVKVGESEGQSQSRPSTPAQVKNLKVSNKLYAMSPRSWKPDNSVGDSVPVESLGFDLTVGDKPASPSVMRYTYSGQIEGHAVEWNPHDSLGTPVPPAEAATPTPYDSTNFQTPRDSTDFPRETPTPRESTDYPRNTPTPSSRQRKRWQTPQQDTRPFSAQRAAQAAEREASEVQRQHQSRPNSSTGGTEPIKRQARQLPKIDRDLEGPQKTRALRQKEKSSEGWMSDDGSGDKVMRSMSASRTRHWVASQNSSQFETEVQPFERSSSDLDAADSQVTPRPGSRVTPRVKSRQQKPPMSARSSISRNSAYEESGRESRAIADGKISRLSIPDVELSDGPSTGSRSGSRSSSVRLSNDQGYDINTKLRGDELSDTEEERAKSSMGVDEEEVRALH
ncbi:hypothetical protein BaRGS_00039596 [Batillaria attramentaria]|uniref:B box-type domain-containing protein n=1 Tax=Batillaria attramentaria TaxID=370345 RepID=A0ABD0J2N9_9CAEN